MQTHTLELLRASLLLSTDISSYVGLRRRLVECLVYIIRNIRVLRDNPLSHSLEQGTLERPIEGHE